MSDFYLDLQQRWKTVWARAVGLDFGMWEAKQNKPQRLPYPFCPIFAPGYAEQTYQGHVAECVDRVYWQREPLPRRIVRRSDFAAQSMAELYGDVVPKQRNVGIQTVAKRLGVTTRHTRRMLTRLLRAGKVPNDWRQGKRWFLPEDEAVEVIGRETDKRHEPHTSATRDFIASEVERYRREVDRLMDELDEMKMMFEVCERWYFLTHTAPPKDALFFVKSSHRENERRRAYNLMATLAEKWRWRFCGLLVAVIQAEQNGAKTPMNDARVSLGMDQSEFYRCYGEAERTRALELAGRVFGNPDWLVRQPRAQFGDGEIETVFSDAQQMVPEEDRWEQLN